MIPGGLRGCDSTSGGPGPSQKKPLHTNICPDAGEMQNRPMGKVHPVNIALKRALLSLQGKNDVQKLPGDGLAQDWLMRALLVL